MSHYSHHRHSSSSQNLGLRMSNGEQKINANRSSSGLGNTLEFTPEYKARRLPGSKLIFFFFVSRCEYEEKQRIGFAQNNRSNNKHEKNLIFSPSPPPPSSLLSSPFPLQEKKATNERNDKNFRVSKSSLSCHNRSGIDVD